MSHTLGTDMGQMDNAMGHGYSLSGHCAIKKSHKSGHDALCGHVYSSGIKNVCYMF